jgi:spore maturation protein A
VNFVFTILVTVSVFLLILNRPEETVAVMLSGAESAALFCVKLFAVLAVWNIVLRLLEKSGGAKLTDKLLKPVTKRLFHGETDETIGKINLNLSLNMLGVGGAATPAGIEAMKTMQTDRSRTLFTVINALSVQILPLTMLSLRSSHGATTDVLLPFLIVNTATTAIGIVLCLIFCKKNDPIIKIPS